jgi:uncharacterized SAM-binding protein YcdF (DUF218 family)
VKRRRLLRYAAVASALAILFAAFALPRLGSWLVVQDSLQKADAIVVLGGTRYERPLEAVDLYQEGWASRIFLMRQIADDGELELMKRGVGYSSEVNEQIDVMSRVGVPASAITVLDEANSTANEADHVAQLVATSRLSRVIIVTSKLHTRRARLVMRRRLAGTGTTIIVRASRYDRADVDRWWQHRSSLSFTLFETQRLIAYWTGIAD